MSYYLIANYRISNLTATFSFSHLIERNVKMRKYTKVMMKVHALTTCQRVGRGTCLLNGCKDKELKCDITTLQSLIKTSKLAAGRPV